MTVTLREIANQTGLTLCSVSVALRGKKGISEENRRRVLRVAKNLGYSPNLSARAMVTGRTRLVGLLLPTSYSDVAITHAKVRAVEKGLSAMGYHVLLRILEASAASELDCCKTFKERKVDGLIVFGGTPSLIESLHSSLKAPIVIMDHIAHGHEAYMVRIDRAPGVAQACEHLLGLGHREIALLVSAPSQKSMQTVRPDLPPFVQQRIDGLNRAFETRGLLKHDPSLILYPAENVEGYYQATCHLLNKFSPTAVICANDYFCLGARDAILEQGLRIPQDISLVGHDDFDFAPHFSPPLTTVRQPVEQVAQRVVALIDDLMTNGKKQSSEDIILTGKLVIRKSTARCRGP